jgi:hypothetical protein
MSIKAQKHTVCTCIQYIPSAQYSRELVLFEPGPYLSESRCFFLLICLLCSAQPGLTQVKFEGNKVQKHGCAPTSAAIKKYYRRKKGLELSCSICGPTITRDKIAVTTWILPVRSLQVIGWLFPEVKIGLLHNKGKNKGK